MVTHSNILALQISWIEEPGKLQSMGLQRANTTEHMRAHAHTHPHTHI